MFDVNAPWLLAVSYFLHLVATVVWIGGLVTMALIVWPALRRALTDDAEFARLIESIDVRFRPLWGLSFAVLLVTGFVQMTASPHYRGFLTLSNTWAQAILLKHLAVIGMVAIGAWMAFGVQPALRRNAMLAAHALPNEPEAAALRRRQARLARLNILLGILVLVCTAVARAQ